VLFVVGSLFLSGLPTPNQPTQLTAVKVYNQRLQEKESLKVLQALLQFICLIILTVKCLVDRIDR
jgi:hypothetical protein